MKTFLRFFAVCCVAFWPARSSAQEIGKALQDKYVVIFDSILQDWNKRILELPSKSALQDQFFKMLDARVQQKLGGYEDDRWRQRLRTNWEQLPSDLRPTLQISDGARLAILGGFVDNLRDIRREVKADGASILQATGLPLFVVLGWSQLQALKEGAQAISSEHIRQSIAAFYTGVYPICRRPPPKNRLSKVS